MMLSALVAIAVGAFCAPVNLMLTLAQHPDAKCDLVAVDGIGDRVGVAMPRCTWLNGGDESTEIAVYVVLSK